MMRIMAWLCRCRGGGGRRLTQSVAGDMTEPFPEPRAGVRLNGPRGRGLQCVNIGPVAGAGPAGCTDASARTRNGHRNDSVFKIRGPGYDSRRRVGLGRHGSVTSHSDRAVTAGPRAGHGRTPPGRRSETFNLKSRFQDITTTTTHGRRGHGIRRRLPVRRTTRPGPHGHPAPLDGTKLVLACLWSFCLRSRQIVPRCAPPPADKQILWPNQRGMGLLQS